MTKYSQEDQPTSTVFKALNYSQKESYSTAALELNLKKEEKYPRVTLLNKV